MGKINEEVSKKQRDCERDLAKAEPALQAAVDALNTLNKVPLHSMLFGKYIKVNYPTRVYYRIWGLGGGGTLTKHGKVGEHLGAFTPRHLLSWRFWFENCSMIQ